MKLRAYSRLKHAKNVHRNRFTDSHLDDLSRVFIILLRDGNRINLIRRKTAKKMFQHHKSNTDLKSILLTVTSISMNKKILRLINWLG